MPTKLQFKGDDDKKKKKRKRLDEYGDEGPTRRHKKRGSSEFGGDGGIDNDDTWVLPENELEIRGPAFIFHPSDPMPICISFDATRAKVMLTPLDKERTREDENGKKDGQKKGEAARGDGPSAASAGSGSGLLAKTPMEISQVWVVTRVAGSPTINLRTGVASSVGSGETKFLSCDQHGLVSAFREARGPQEEWTPVVLPSGMVAFQNIYEKYLSVDEVAGGALALRGDSEEIGFREQFWVKIQNKYKKEANEEERKKKEVVVKNKIDEAGTNRVYQAWGAGRSVVSNDDRRELQKAREQGRLSEALLDRRAKLKHDRFC